jgi:hypothetical protein
MTLEEFERSVRLSEPPEGLSQALLALWHDANGNWNRAHETAQEVAGSDGAWVHAYLHRKEGDRSNASYWYRQAGQAEATGPLDDEWKRIAEALLRV